MRKLLHHQAQTMHHILFLYDVVPFFNHNGQENEVTAFLSVSARWSACLPVGVLFAVST